MDIKFNKDWEKKLGAAVSDNIQAAVDRTFDAVHGQPVDGVTTRLRSELKRVGANFGAEELKRIAEPIATNHRVDTRPR